MTSVSTTRRSNRTCAYKDVFVVTSREGRVGRIKLNRSNDKNRFNLAMYSELTSALHSWLEDDRVELVLLDHVDETLEVSSGFEVERLAEEGREFGGQVDAYLTAAYRLISLLANYPKPVVTLLDGQVKSSAVGLAVSSRYRIATERTALSFPDTGFGYVPDAGASRFLARLPGEMGAWLALTGARLEGGDVAAVGLATSFCSLSEITDLKDALKADGVRALASWQETPALTMSHRLEEITSGFRGDCAKEIHSRLLNGGGWAKAQASKMALKSPLCTKIALRLIRTGQFLGTTDDALKLEYRVTSRLLKSREFREGVRAKLIDQYCRPYWEPPSLPRVSYDLVAKFFSPHGLKGLRLAPIEP